MLEEPVTFVYEVTFQGHVYARCRPVPRALYGSSGMCRAQLWKESSERVIVSRYALTKIRDKRRYACYEVFRTYDAALTYTLTT